MSTFGWHRKESSTDYGKRLSAQCYVVGAETETQKIVQINLESNPELRTLSLKFRTVEIAKDFETYLETYLQKYFKMPEGQKIKLPSESLEDLWLVFDFFTEITPSALKNDQVFLLMALGDFDKSLLLNPEQNVLRYLLDEMKLRDFEEMILFYYGVMETWPIMEFIEAYERSAYRYFPTHDSFKAALMFAERFDLSLNFLDLCERASGPYYISIALLSVPDAVLNKVSFEEEGLARSGPTPPPSEVEALFHAAVGGVLPPPRPPAPYSEHYETAVFLFSNSFKDEDETIKRFRLTFALAHILLMDLVTEDSRTLGLKIYGELSGNPFEEGPELPIFNCPASPKAHLQTIEMAFSLSLTAQEKREQNLKIKALEAEIQRLKTLVSGASSSLPNMVYGAGAASRGAKTLEDHPPTDYEGDPYLP